MKRQNSVAIISIGTELTEGIIRDVHLHYLANQLKIRDMVVEKAVYLPDDFEVIERESKRALEDCSLIIFTGGLGPTSDDLTRDVIASVTETKLVFVEEIWNKILTRFRGRRVSEANKKQAMIPSGFECLDNNRGTAPGFYGRYKDSVIIALPGPPKELSEMFEREALPRIVNDFNLGIGMGETNGVLRGSVFMTPESELEEALGNCREIGINWGTRVTEFNVEFVLRGKNEVERRKVFNCLKEKLGNLRVRLGSLTPAMMLFNLLRDKKYKLATVESCTGGLIGKLITDIPGSSSVYWGGWVVYSNGAKEELLGVDVDTLTGKGAVSTETVEALCRGALKESGADIAIAVSGIAGPTGGSKDKPVGTVFIGVAMNDGGYRVKRFCFFGSRDLVRRKSAIAAFVLAENLILETEWLDRYESW